MKILLSAYACEPNQGSEPGVGWNMAQAIAQTHQVWVLTTATHRAGIEAELLRRPNLNLQVIYLDPFGWVYDWSKGGKGVQWDVHLHHYLWQLNAYWIARSLHQQHQFDRVHHATYGRYSAPSFLSLLPIPFIWGPVGGGESAPRSFWHEFSRKGQLYEWLRELARWTGEWDPFVRMTARRSAIALACTPETAQRLQVIGAGQVKMLAGQTGITQQDFLQLQAAKPEIRDPQQPIRFLSLGRLIHWKGFHLGLRAFAAANLPQAEYWVAGTGAEQAHLEDLVTRLGIRDRVKFLGSLKRDQALQVLGQSDVLVHPSLHDFSPTVCLEGMAAGLPVLCLDLGGPSIQITEETGIKVPAPDPETAVQGLAIAMQTLATQPDLRERMGQAGQARVHQFYQWESRSALFSEIYDQAEKR
ncbi:MAG: glycosyltransferase family 4 protein [Synechococcales bacterium]|nr:glycosyltransferase family 4 protein [Synechococcales bacterium]